MNGPGPGRLHVLTDEQLQSRFTHVELARLAVRGGADVIQLRDKRTQEFGSRAAEAAQVLAAMRDTPARLVVNDHLEVALAVGGAGVHLGARDGSPWSARRALGQGKLIGATANDLGRAMLLRAAPVDYLGVGPVFGTGSKSEPAPALGLDGLRRIAAAVPLPLIAIGNVTPERVRELLAAGAHGVAVLSAIVLDQDPEARTAEFAAAIRAALAERVA